MWTCCCLVPPAYWATLHDPWWIYSQYTDLQLLVCLYSHQFTLLVLWVPVPWQQWPIRSLYLALDLCPLPLSCWLNNSRQTAAQTTFWICQGCFIQKLFRRYHIKFLLVLWRWKWWRSPAWSWSLELISLQWANWEQNSIWTNREDVQCLT